jgi:hypothetical protein
MSSCNTLVSENLPLIILANCWYEAPRRHHLGPSHLWYGYFSVINTNHMLVTNTFVLKRNSAGYRLTSLLECDPLNLNVKADMEHMRQG